MIQNWPEIAGYVASALVFITFSMKTIVPLRVAAILSNVAFILYGAGAGLVPILILHSVLLPLNVLRTWQHLAATRRIRRAAEGPADVGALLPFMTQKTLPEAHRIFRKGDGAEEMYYIREGQVYLPEIDKHLEAGEFFGEIGLFTDQHARITSAVCSQPCELSVIGKKRLVELYLLEPAFAFYLTKLITNRMYENMMRRQEAETR